VRVGQLCAGWQELIADWVRDRVLEFGVAKRSIEIRINGVTSVFSGQDGTCWKRCESKR